MHEYSKLLPTAWPRGQIVWLCSHFLHIKVQFRPQSGIFVHILCALFIPFWPFWPDLGQMPDLGLDFDSRKLMWPKGLSIDVPIASQAFCLRIEVVNTTGAPWAWP
jgi:hypothetical protein